MLVLRAPREGRNLDITILQKFLAVSFAGSFTKAAATLSMAQPILSRQIRALETEIGADLFYRNGRGIVLTEAGHLFQVRARHVVGQMSDALNEIKSLQATPSGELTVGLPPTVGNILTARLVQAFRKKYPQITLAVLEGFSGLDRKSVV